jgi:hypothetical protein
VERLRCAVIFVICVALASVARAACVEVTSIKPQESSPNLRIVVRMDGTPLSGTKLEVYEDAMLAFSVLTDANGIATPPKLAIGSYSITATPYEAFPGLLIHGDATAVLWLSVVDKKGESLLHMDLASPVQEAQQTLEKAEKLPITAHINAFRGTILDPTGAVVARASIQVVKKGPEDNVVVLRTKADAKGQFSAHLAEGLYIAFAFSPGFRTAIVPFEVTKVVSGDLRIILDVGAC